MEDLP